MLSYFLCQFIINMKRRFQVGVVDRRVYDFTSSYKFNIAVVHNGKKNPRKTVTTIFIEVDSHVYMIVPGDNFCLLYYTGR